MSLFAIRISILILSITPLLIRNTSNGQTFRNLSACSPNSTQYYVPVKYPALFHTLDIPPTCLQCPPCSECLGQSACLSASLAGASTDGVYSLRRLEWVPIGGGGRMYGGEDGCKDLCGIPALPSMIICWLGEKQWLSCQAEKLYY